MEKQRIKELIVVEGKNDTHTLKRYFDCETIETHGMYVSKETLDRIEEAYKRRGVIIFTDPDTPGEKVRRAIQKRIPQAKHVFIDKSKARTSKKVGVEHANQEDLWNALKHAVTFSNESESLSWPEFIDLGLIGDSVFRKKVCDAFHIGKCNAKTCFKRLNQMNVTKNEILNRIEGK